MAFSFQKAALSNHTFYLTLSEDLLSLKKKKDEASKFIFEMAITITIRAPGAVAAPPYATETGLEVRRENDEDDKTSPGKFSSLN